MAGSQITQPGIAVAPSRSSLRARLRAIGRARRGLAAVATLARATALAILLLGVEWLIDYTFNLVAAARLFALAVGAGLLIAWLSSRRQRASTSRDPDIDTAIWLEQQQDLENDLVAALQFEWPEAPTWGSAQLERAVVDYVGQFSHDLHADLGLERRAARRGVGWLVVALGAALLLATTWPDHLAAFGKRLMLRATPYPTQTMIVGLAINGQEVDLESSTQPVVRAPYGSAVEFVATARGQLPGVGRLRLRSLKDQIATELELRVDEAHADVFTARLPRLVEDVDVVAYLGDATTQVIELRAIPLPVVTVNLEARPPEYAQSQATAAPSTHQLAVVEGTDVTVGVECVNKPLRRAICTIDGKPWPMMRQHDARHWKLEPAGTALAAIHEPIRYEVQVVDEDGLQLAEPIQGSIRIKADRPPRVTAVVVTQHVLPTGKPKISYGAVDDFGVATLKLRCLVQRADGTSDESIADLPLDAEHPRLVQERWPFDLRQLKLAKGDQLKLTLEATDWRGAVDGKTASSEPLVLHVTDERGVLAAMAEADQRTARQMDAIIQRQLGLGEER